MHEHYLQKISQAKDQENFFPCVCVERLKGTEELRSS